MIGEIDIVRDGNDIFVTVDGLRIAKRGGAGWISLEHGWTVVDRFKGDKWEVEVSFDGAEFTVH